MAAVRTPALTRWAGTCASALMVTDSVTIRGRAAVRVLYWIRVDILFLLKCAYV